MRVTIAVAVIFATAVGQVLPDQSTPVIRTNAGNLVASLPAGKSFSVSCPELGAVPCTGTSVAIVGGQCVSASTPCSGPEVNVTNGQCTSAVPRCHGGTDVTITSDGQCECSLSAQSAQMGTAGPFTDLLESPVVWLGFNTIDRSRQLGPQSNPSERIISFAGRGLEQFDFPELDNIFQSNFMSTTNASQSLMSDPCGVNSLNGRARVVCTAPAWPHDLGTAVIQLFYLGNGTATMVPYQGPANGNNIGFVQSFRGAQLSSQSLIVSVQGIGFPSNGNIICTFSAGGRSYTTSVPANSTTSAVCGGIDTRQLNLGDGINVAVTISIAVGTANIRSLQYQGVPGGNIVTIPDTCVDGIMDGNETDVDCGGAGRCNPCESGASCRTDSDCDSGLVCSGNICETGNVHLLPRARAGMPALSVSGNTDFTQPTRRITSINGQSVTVSETWTGLQANEIVLVISSIALSTNGPSTINISSIGNYEMARVQAVSGSTVTLASPLTKTYNENNRLHRVYMQRVPEYSSVNIARGSTLSARWFDSSLAGVASRQNGANTGIIAFTVRGTLNMESGAAIDASSSGYWGGTCNNRNDGGSGGGGGWGRGGYSDGTTSTSYPGNCRQSGGGGGGAISTSSCPNGAGGLGGSGGGGGDNAAGGGGGHGSPGGAGGGYSRCRGTSGGSTGRSGRGGRHDSNSFGRSGIAGGGGGGDNCGGGGGGTYGYPVLEPQIFFGGSGGGSGLDNCNSRRNGGNGGGIIIIRAGNVTSGSSASIRSRGGSPYYRNTRSNAGGGSSDGGGAGGSIFLVVDDILTRTSGNTFLDVTGSSGQTASVWGTQRGGSGGRGRIRADYGRLVGTGSLGTPQEAVGSCGRPHAQC